MKKGKQSSVPHSLKSEGACPLKRPASPSEPYDYTSGHHMKVCVILHACAKVSLEASRTEASIRAFLVSHACTWHGQIQIGIIQCRRAAGSFPSVAARASALAINSL
jgi:hypothetical protein